MTRALKPDGEDKQDKVEFVRLFLQTGVDIKEFLTRDKLRELYQTVCEVFVRLSF